MTTPGGRKKNPIKLSRGRALGTPTSEKAHGQGGLVRSGGKGKISHQNKN